MIYLSRGVLAGGAVLLALGMALPRVLPIPSDHSRQLGEMRVARDSLATYDDATLERLRRETASKEDAAWTEERWRSWTGGLGPRWRVRAGDEPGTYFIERAADQIGDWAPFVEAVRTWSRLPGLTVQAVEINATGRAGGRRFMQRSLLLRVQLATGADALISQNQIKQP